MADDANATASAPEFDFIHEATPEAVKGDIAAASPAPPEKQYDPTQDREAARGDLARGLLWLLGFTVSGILVFIALGRIDGSVVTQSIFPSLIALAGTALGFYFGAGQAAPNQTKKE